jgi:hypothetical protein
MSKSYHFITKWRIEATREEIYRTLEDVEELTRWWCSVYLDLNVLEKGQKGGIGKVVELYTKGFLPYTLRWKFKVTETNFPHGFALEAFGDFVGKGVWTFQQDGKFCDITYDWKIDAEKPLLKRLSFLMKPIFSANHKWAMAKGLESLQLELARKRANTEVERKRIPAPPAPTFPHNIWRNKALVNTI